MDTRDKSHRPTNAEMEVLQVLWKHGPSTVREVNDEIAKTRNVGYTTTLKVMQIMVDKESLRRDESGKAHVYSPAESTKVAKTAILADVIERVFDGSAADLVLHALGGQRATTQELAEIKALIRSLEEGK
ncbi:MAG: BlaI/MecI/CopY family transcriptional regulator [Fimbriimonadaceae bacterium]|nr:BlaI/MecI/CopY family transcriptional regulator [Fimbriimonadaceae bacterium]